MTARYDAVVVGSGPNGLAAAITIAEAGRSVLVIEGAETVGGGTRSYELPGTSLVGDICSAVHPMAVSSPFFTDAGLEEYGLEWVHPELPLAHPFDDGSAAVLARSLRVTAEGFGEDGPAYRRLMAPLVREWPRLAAGALGPVTRPPSHPVLMARFGYQGVRSATGLTARFKGDGPGALLMGSSAHAIVPLDRPLSASFGLVLVAAGHAAGWPFAKGGSQAIADAMVARLKALGGEVETGRLIRSMSELPPARATLFDTTPRQLIQIAGGRMSDGDRRAYERFRLGAAAFKVDFALDRPIPWTAGACHRAGTVHVGGSVAEIVASERAVRRGTTQERPLVIVAQQSRIDRSRAPDGGEAVWAYCHVPRGSKLDMTDTIERQIERFAPGFRDTIVSRHVSTPATLEGYNPNYIGGDIAGGAHDGLQLLFRPRFSLDPYRTGIPGVYLCSSSTPPGAGVHGMCGYWAARSALNHDLG